MMGVATKTKKFVDIIEGTNATILDTRKTIPGMRALQRLAVMHGGGQNHRYSLSDAILIKENHVSMCPNPLAKLGHMNNKKIEIEVRNIQEFKEALIMKPDIIMLDNMSIKDVAEAVDVNDSAVKLEVSGGINETTIADYAKTGVDYISVGALTHSIESADLSFLFQGA